MSNASTHSCFNRLMNPTWAVPIIATLLVVLLSPYLDMAIARFFYHAETQHFSNSAFYKFMFDYGSFPAIALACFAAAAYLISYFRSSWKVWRKPTLVLILTMIVGAGFLVHTVFKDHWGRPRPKQVIEFGGKQEFRPFFKPNFFNQPEPSKSFPCGHCTMGFYFFALILVGKRLNQPLVFYGGIILTIVIGTAMALARMGQGGHFFSDVVMSGVIMWMIAVACDWLIYAEEDRQR
jgi:lipid A 4'-phosphatase